MMVESEPALQV
jgi:hypothetical protein